ncbi:exodeoxyribonuclease V subunit alpha [Tahibacter soli]|uniref:RecBCD enzyme subunit RecD n=1 Tax=Tahibacter soli TaxID=2983605 RepID=A0A9X3YL34_9GAMM|nr:exodeoxyribonuclease V subunit alpha [Tahibacter soli]MDC8013225.1 exodeoxyribonuclease V subunit alpha [Tahibacter soli]
MAADAIARELDRAVANDDLRALDRAFALFLAELDPAASPALLLAAALCSRALGTGHPCLDLADPDIAELREKWRGFAPELGDVETWRAHLAAAPLVAGDDAPLVVADTRVYLRRYYDYERSVAAAITARVARPPSPPEGLAHELDRLFGPARAGVIDWQKIACALAARGAFAVITGGPGTGKTTTVVKLLGLLQTLALRDETRTRLRIRLAAPTGKAAARLNESIAQQIDRLDVDAAVKEAIPAEVSTLHRLLGSRPDTRRFRHHRGNPLHLDVLVIDEASMVDLELMSAVLDALPDAARLVLLGDKDQLASVEAGAVLGDLCRHAAGGGYDAATVAWLAEVCGEDVSAYAATGTPRALDRHIAMLRTSHRFGGDSAIGKLALAVNRGDAAAVRAAFAAGGDVARLEAATRPDVAAARLAVPPRDATSRQLGLFDAAPAEPGYRHYLDVLARARPAERAEPDAWQRWAGDVLAARNAFQLLCAVRHGDAGVVGVNDALAQALVEAGLVAAGHEWYEGRPVMLTRNDYGLGLMNGDLGVALRVPDDAGRTRLLVAFAVTDAQGRRRLRFVAPSRLDAVETVYAMTVHKSQGSEFEHVALVLPVDDAGVVTRELMYTAVTRARRRFSLIADAAVVDGVVQRVVRRSSGLAAEWS